MTDINHRRTNRPPVDRRHPTSHYHNGYARQDGTDSYADGEPIEREQSSARVGSTGYLDKSMHGWGGKAPVSGKRFGASIPNDFANGHRGMARAVAGAKNFVRTRTRFHDNAATKRLAEEIDDDLD